jgi:hypothetical protein
MKIYIRTFHTRWYYIYNILFSNFAYECNQTKANKIDRNTKEHNRTEHRINS